MVHWSAEDVWRSADETRPPRLVITRLPAQCRSSPILRSPRVGPTARAAAQLHHEPLTALPIRRAVVMLLCGKADVVHDDQRPGDPLVHAQDHGASVIRLRTTPGALPGLHPDDRAAPHAPRPVPLRLLWREGRHRRPRGAAAAAGRPLLGRTAWRRARRATTARPTSCSPSWAGRCGWFPPRPGASIGGCCPPSKELDPAWARYLGEGAA